MAPGRFAPAQSDRYRATDATDVQAWARLDYSVRTGRPAFDLVHGLGYWDYLAAHPELSAVVDQMNDCLTRLHLRTLLPAYDWASLGTVMDVGGGTGAFVAGLLALHATLRGILFDRPDVVARALATLRAAGVVDRCELVAGNFYNGVPAGAGAYVMKTVLPGFDDTNAVAILKVVRAAMRQDARLLCLEALLPPGDTYDVAKLVDVQALVLAGGAHRTRDQVQGLLASASLELRRVVPTPTLTIIEARSVGVP